MDKLKDNKGGIIAAVAAGALALGLIIYASSGKSKSADDDDDKTQVDQQDCEPTEEDIQNFFFLDASSSIEEQEKEINKWVQDQVDALLGENDDNKLSVSDFKISESDF